MDAGRDEQQAIEGLMQRFAEAFNARDAVSLAALFAEDAEFVTIFGGRLSGRAAIRGSHAGMFAHAPGGHRLAMQPGPDVKRLAPDLLLAHANWTRERLPDAPDGAPPSDAGLFTLIARQNGDRWELLAATNSQQRTPPWET